MSAPASGSADASDGAGDLPRRLLLKVFGHEGFRPGQEDVIAAAVAGRDVLAVMPTSGGKSLCYQVPALMGEGLTVVVSPLVSLMKDQIDALRARVEASDEEVPAGAVAALHSSLSVSERRRVERRVLSGEARILYVAPERLRSLELVLLLRRAGGGAGVSLVVVDEAHCTSEWGHSFRPEYLFLRTAIGDLAPREHRPPVMALTATADPRVRRDIVELLGLRELEVVRTGFDRPNLRYRVRWVAEDGRLDTVVRALGSEAGEAPAIVYAHTRSRCEELASALSSRGIPAQAYHAGMGPAERDAVQGRFMDDELPVIVATVAFGMGVDKPNVRTVIHAGVPASIPAYVQEAGRAGRDGRPASSTVLFSPEELDHRKDLARTNLTTAEDAKAFFEALKGIGVPEGAGPNAGKLRANPNPQEISRLGEIGAGAAADALRSLEAMGRVRRGYNLWAEVRIERLPPGAVPTPDDSSVGAGVLRALARRGAASRVPLVELAREVGASPAAVQAALARLIGSGEIEAAPKGRIADLLVKPAPLGRRELADLGARFEHRSEQEVRHLEEVAAYASLTTCRRARLLSHFGDEAAELVAPCDGCDVCRGRNRGVPSLLRRLFGGLADAFAPAGT